MTSPAPTIAQARAALFDLLLADAPDSVAYTPVRKVLVAFGLPGHEELEVVSLLGVRAATEDAGALGAIRREEEYDLDVVIKVHHPAAGDDPTSRKAVDGRGFALLTWARSVVHGHWTLNGTVRTALVTGEITDGVQPAEKTGLVWFALMTVHCEASIVDNTAAP